MRVPACHRAARCYRGLPRIRLPRKHFMDYISHKGDRGHDSAEPVSSAGWWGRRRLAGGPGSPTGSPRARVEGGSGSFWGAERNRRGAAARPQLTPDEGGREREMGALEPASVGPQAKRKSYISRLSRTSSFRARSRKPIAVWARWLLWPIRPRSGRRDVADLLLLLFFFF